MLTTDFATYAPRRVRPFALPLTLAGAGCHHGSRRCWQCAVLANAYAAALDWAAGLASEHNLAEPGDQTMVQLRLEVNA